MTTFDPVKDLVAAQARWASGHSLGGLEDHFFPIVRQIREYAYEEGRRQALASPPAGARPSRSGDAGPERSVHA